MFDQIKNRKGEKLYILTIVFTNNIMPHNTVDTWENCKKKFESFCQEVNNDRFFAQLIHKEIDEEAYKAEASMRCNQRGWGPDFFRYMTINPLYTEAW